MSPKSIKQSLYFAFLKRKTEKAEIEKFEKEFSELFERINEKESEEFHKGLIKDFLNALFYKGKHYINTNGKTDLVIHNTNSEKSSVGVVIETKSPFAKSGEMISVKNLNVKSLQQLVLYYMRERKAKKNIELRHLIITNLYEWFVFDARNFEITFGSDKKLEKSFAEFENKKSAITSTDGFYKDVAAPAVERHSEKLEFVYFDIRKEDKNMLHKFFAPENLLKIQTETTDGNQLNKEFYEELLHIIGLEEIADGGKKIIDRKKKDRDYGSILENAMERIGESGKVKDGDLYDCAFDLAITWINRILFLKLLESQILKYHGNDKNYAFLSSEKLSGYGDLNTLFFGVLAKKINERSDRVSAKFADVPYLNSSLFEQTDMENSTISINSLDDNAEISLYSKSVLRGYVRQGEHIGSPLRTPNTVGADLRVCPKLQMKPLEYLFKFLDAYDFSGDDNDKTLISAAVLGLIFEKINGHKDGSFFTPSFITMYMCRETIGRAAVQKFNEIKGWDCETTDDLQNHFGKNAKDIIEANKIFNSIKICDPSVGSGHFLVSALNEMIWLKYKLGILADKDGKLLRDLEINIENDELIVKNSDGDIFTYNPKIPESQRVQETFFGEKQTIIENCLFGVDINPNSVKICRLRLWIELLKNAYYIVSSIRDLQTLPNIDINIKCGNSLISRFDLRRIVVDGREIGAGNLATTAQKIGEYKNLVSLYKRCTDLKEGKKDIREKIENIKKELYEIKKHQDLDYLEWQAAKTKYDNHLSSMRLDEKRWDSEREKLEKEMLKREKAYSEKATGNAFEWSFEFPEVLDENGNFVGFDLVIGNPPYVLCQPSNTPESVLDFYKRFEVATYKIDLFHLFFEQGAKLVKQNGEIAYITPNTYLTNKHIKPLREFILKNTIVRQLSLHDENVFSEASVEVATIILCKQKKAENTIVLRRSANTLFETIGTKEQNNWLKNLDCVFNIQSDFNLSIQNCVMLGEICNTYFGIQAFDRKTAISQIKENDHFLEIIDGGDISPYSYAIPTKYFNYVESNIKSGGDWNVYKQDRIVVRQIGQTPVVGMCEKNILASNTLYSIFTKTTDYHLNYILCLLNSSVIKKYWLAKYSDNKNLFPKIKGYQMKELPIKKISLSEQKPFIDLVDKILSAKKENPSADTSEWEKEIDLLVYGLYGLTEEEIGIIERK